jgi:hypothetical protein
MIFSSIAFEIDKNATKNWNVKATSVKFTIAIILRPFRDYIEICIRYAQTIFYRSSVRRNDAQ